MASRRIYKENNDTCQNLEVNNACAIGTERKILGYYERKARRSVFEIITVFFEW